ncbi:MAG: hypothetical protein ACO1N0_13365 [Fluviicola sp.]
MKATEKGQSKKDKKSGGVSPIVAAFASGAATGLAIGLFISSGKGSGFKDKVAGLIKNFGGGDHG